MGDNGELLSGIHALGASLLRLVEHNAGGEQPGMLDTAEAARMLGMNSDYVRDAIRSGGLAAYRFGRLWRIKRDDLEAFMLRQRISRTSVASLEAAGSALAPRPLR